MYWKLTSKLSCHCRRVGTQPGLTRLASVSFDAANTSTPAIRRQRGRVCIAVYEEGHSEGPTVVVHGFPDSHVLWDGVVPLLTERFRVIRYDNRGWAAPEHPNRCPRTRWPDSPTTSMP